MHRALCQFLCPGHRDPLNLIDYQAVILGIASVKDDFRAAAPSLDDYVRWARVIVWVERYVVAYPAEKAFAP